LAQAIERGLGQCVGIGYNILLLLSPKAPSDGKRFVVRAEERLTAFVDRIATITGEGLLLDQANWLSARPAAKVFSAATNSSNQKSNARESGFANWEDSELQRRLGGFALLRRGHIKKRTRDCEE